MMEKDIKLWHSMSDLAILKILGNYIRQNRLRQNKTQQHIAIIAGLNRSTLIQIENGGGGTLLSFVQIVRALELLQLFQNFEISQQFSPLQLAKIDQKKRQRASNKKNAKVDKPKSDW